MDGVQDPTSVLHLDRDPDVGFERIQPGGRLPQVHPQTGVPQNSAEGGRCRAHRGYGEDSLLFGRRVLEVTFGLLFVFFSISEFQIEHENSLKLLFNLSPTALTRCLEPWTSATRDPLRTISQGWMMKSMLQLIIMVLLHPPPSCLFIRLRVL